MIARARAWLHAYRALAAYDELLWISVCLTALAILSIFLTGCAARPVDTRLGSALRAPPYPATGPAPTPSPTYFPGGPRPPNAVVMLRLGGVLVYPPAWFPRGDEDALGQAVEEYLRDAEVALAWKLPTFQFGRPLVLVLHDDQARTWAEYDSGYRLAILRWPAGPSGFPVAEHILPDLGRVLAEEHRIDTGRAMRGFDADEQRVIVEARRWPVRIMTAYPWLYQP